MTDTERPELLDFRTNEEEERFNEWYYEIDDVEKLTYPEIAHAAWLQGRDFDIRSSEGEKAVEPPPRDYTVRSQPATISVDDFHLRHLALSFAVEPGRTRADILASAKEYLNFLSGTETSAKEAGS